MFIFKKEHIDPNTGDPITRSERMSLFAQAVMRKWSFVLAYSVLTFFWWTHPQVFGDHPGSDARWQDWASYMALLIESLVGIGMFGWARRDSVFIRKLYALERASEQRDEADRAITHVIAKHTAALMADAQAKANAAHAQAHATANDAQVAVLAWDTARRKAESAEQAHLTARRDAEAADFALGEARRAAEEAKAALAALEGRHGES